MSRVSRKAAAPSANPSSRNRARARSRNPASAAPTRPIESGAQPSSTVSVKSCRISEARRPHAEKLPGSFGTSTLSMPSSSATVVACMGPAPPNAISTHRRGSWPRDIEISRIEATILATAIRTTPSAIRQGSSTPARRASATMALSTRSIVGAIRPPSRRRIASRPSQRFASVTVTSRPPRP